MGGQGLGENSAVSLSGPAPRASGWPSAWALKATAGLFPLSSVAQPASLGLEETERGRTFFFLFFFPFNSLLGLEVHGMGTIFNPHSDFKSRLFHVFEETKY